MSNLKETNKKVIEAAIKHFKEQTNVCFQKGMEDLLDAAVEFALASHDEGHQQHLIQGDSYGWALFRNKQFVSYKIFSRVRKKENELLQEMKTIQPPSSKCWCGVIMAGMQPVGYFSIDYELNIFELTKDEIKANFNRYFKPLSR